MKPKCAPSSNKPAMKSTRTGDHFPRLRRAPLALLAATAMLAALAATPGHAQRGDPSLTAEVTSRRIAVGETGTLMITALNGEPEGLPASLDIPGLQVQSAGTQFSFSTDSSGARVSKFTHLYRFRADEEGTCTIPAITATVRGRELTTDPIEITVTRRAPEEHPADGTRPYFGRLETDTLEVYTNQVVPLDVKVYVKGRNAIERVGRASLDHESFVIRNFRKVRTDAVELGGSLYSMAVLPTSIFALKPGEHTLGPAEVTVRRIDSRSGFGFPSIFQRTQNLPITTETLTLVAKPLPEGAPDSFQGGVGNFDLALTPSTTSLVVGDPISLEFEITGTGNLGTLGPPVFTVDDPDRWKSYDPSGEIDPEEESDGVAPGRVEYSQVLIPLEEIAEIPPFEISFFNPDTGSYETRRTDPVPIEVRPDPSGAKAQAPARVSADGAGTGENTPHSAAAPPRARYDDVLHIRTTPPAWRTLASVGAGPGLLFHAAQVLLSIGFFTLVGFGLAKRLRQRKQARADSRATPTFREAVRNVPRSGAPRRDYYRSVADALDIWKREHEDAPEKLADLIEQFSSRCETRLYSGADQPDEPVPESEAAEFDQVLNRLARH